MTKKILSADDIELFRHSIGKVRVVNNDKVLLRKQEKPKPLPKPRTFNVEEDLIGTDMNDIENLTAEDTLAFTAPGLQKNVLKKLRKGQFGMNAEIDLHGLSSQEAKRQLLNFLHYAVMEGFRCVHIVHGKGYRSPANYPILKNNLNIWLRQHKNVLAFCSAPARHGGAGAVYVLLQLS
ncbi:MAG: Smr/MutS family protein [Methylosarcina sp.]